MRRLPLLAPLVASLTACTALMSRAPGPAASGSDSLAVDPQRTWHYLVQLPKGYAQDGREWPLVVFLHGSGERGADLRKVAVHGPPKLVAQGREFPFILVSPQCPDGSWWRAPEVDRFVAAVTRRYRVDPRRVYLVGLSMGGHATWDAATFNPERYAAIVPVCGAGEYAPAVVGERLKDLPVWAFHGARDEVVPPASSRERVEAINAAGGRARLTLYPEAGHDSWTETFDDPELYTWLLGHERR